MAGLDLAGVGLVHAGEDAQQGRLAGAVQAEHDDLRPAVDGEVDGGEDLERAVALREVELSKSYGSLEVFTDVDLAIDKGSRVVILGLNGAGKTTPAADPGRRFDRADIRRGHTRPRPQSSATTRRSTRRSTPTAPCWRTCTPVAATAHRHRGPVGAPGRSCSRGTTRRSRLPCCRVGRRPGWAKLATWWSPSANVLLLDEPTNNLDPCLPRGGARSDPVLPGRDRAGHPTTRAPSTRWSRTAC